MHDRITRSVLGTLLLGCLAPLQAQEEIRRTFAVRIDGRIVGYQIETETPEELDGRPVVRFHTKGMVKLELLGARVDQKVEQTWWLDAESRQAWKFEALMQVGPTKIEAAGQLADAGFVLGDGTTLDPEKTVIAPDFGWIEERVAEGGGEPVAFDYYMPEVGGVQPSTVGPADPAERVIEVLGAKVPVRVYDIEVPGLGTHFRVFVAKGGIIARLESPVQKLVVERAAADVVNRIERVDLTSNMLVETNLGIDDATPLAFMRVEVRCDSTKDVTVESLNAMGQTFEGTVEDGRIEGVFVIRPLRTDGTGSPPFPVAAGTFAAIELQPYLGSEEHIDADDPAVMAMARELAVGATTCFEVVDRLAKWTDKNITYAIPGGTSAQRTLALREGECGGHSRLLAAMLRSLGIPARTPMGAMYVPLYGGSFGQHMWTEVWLGTDIGWLPVDCTAGQSTFIDASHIRLSTTLSAFRPESVKVLDYAPKTAAPAAVVRSTNAYPYAAGETLRYAYSRKGEDLGEEQVTYVGAAAGQHTFTGTIELAGGRFTETTKTVVGDDGRLITFAASRKVGENTLEFDVSREEGKATVDRKSSEGDRNDVVEVEPDVFSLHNNNMAHMAIAWCRIGPLAAGAEAKVRVFHHEQRSVFPLTFTGGAEEQIELGDETVTAQRVDVSLVGTPIVLHVDGRGRILRYVQEQAGVTITLVRSD